MTAHKNQVQYYSHGFYFIGVGTLLVLVAFVVPLSETLNNWLSYLGLLCLVYGNVRAWVDRKWSQAKQGKVK